MKLEDFGLKLKNREILAKKETKVSIKKGEEKLFFDLINKIDSKLKLPFKKFLNDFKYSSIITFFNKNEENLLLEIIDFSDLFYKRTCKVLPFTLYNDYIILERFVENDFAINFKHKVIRLYLKKEDDGFYFIYKEKKYDKIKFFKKEKDFEYIDNIKAKKEIKLIYKLNDLFSLEQFYNNEKEKDILPFSRGNSVEFWKLLLEIHKNDRNIFSDLYKEIELLPENKIDFFEMGSKIENKIDFPEISRKNLFLKNFFENFSFKVNKSYGNLNDVLKEKYQNIKWNKYYNKISFFINFYLLNFIEEISNKENLIREISQNNQFFLNNLVIYISNLLISKFQTKSLFSYPLLIEYKENFFYFFLSNKFNLRENVFDSIFLEDTLILAEKLGENLDITKFKNFKSIKKKHDIFSKKYMEIEEKEKIKKMKFKFEFNDKYFPVIQNLDKKYELITSGKRLFEEGKIQHNCVYSYYNKIKNGNCIIYSLLEDNKRFTIEIVAEKDKFKINQFLGFANSSKNIKKYEKSLIRELEKINKGEENERFKNK